MSIQQMATLQLYHITHASRLIVPVNSGRVGRTIECLYDDGATATLVGREKMNITIGIKT